MQFDIGDKVVHPHHGPGRITAIEQREFLDGKKTYYEIVIPTRELRVFLPRKTLETIGVRPAVSRTTLPAVLDRLTSEPRHLPKDYKIRQEEVSERLSTGRVMKLAEVVRDLTWHEKRHHLTRKDTSQLDQGRSRLAAEMALVSGSEVQDMERTITDTLAATVSAVLEKERRQEQLAQLTGQPETQR